MLFISMVSQCYSVKVLQGFGILAHMNKGKLLQIAQNPWTAQRLRQNCICFAGGSTEHHNLMFDLELFGDELYIIMSAINTQVDVAERALRIHELNK